MVKSAGLAVVALLLVCAAGPVHGQGSGSVDVVRTVDGQAFQCRVLSVDSTRILVAAPGQPKRKLLRAEVASITFHVAATYDVVLLAPGPALITVVKIVKTFTGLGLAQANALVSSPPAVLKSGLSLEHAQAFKAHLVEAGATVEVRPVLP